MSESSISKPEQTDSKEAKTEIADTLSKLDRVRSDPPLIVVNMEDGSSSADNVKVSDKVHMADSSHEELLASLTKRNDDYRFIQFKLDENGEEKEMKKKENYQNRVSFDTVNIGVDRQDDTEEDFEWYHKPQHQFQFNEDLFNMQRGRIRARSPSPGSPRITSPARGISPSLSPPINYADIAKRYYQFRLQYPTRPLITHKGCTFTKFHHKFEDLYSGKLDNEENGHRKPILPYRVILVYINGRKHTWVALDWILRKFIEDGDTIVIMSSIRPELLHDSNRYYEMRSQSVEGSPKSQKERLKYRSRKPYMKVLTNNIMNYALQVVNPDVIARLTVEITVGKTKEVLQDIYRLYQPNIVCTGTKPNERISAPLRSWLSSKLTDRLVKNFPLPVIAVPAMNMSPFEKTLAREISSGRKDNTSSLKKASMTKRSLLNSDTSSISSIKLFGKNGESIDAEIDDTQDDSSDVSSIATQDSLGSVESGISYSSYDEIAKAYKSYEQELERKLEVMRKRKVDSNFYANMLKVISDESLFLCHEIQEINPDFKGDGAKLARAITGSNSFGTVPYKTRSMLTPEKSEDNTSTSGSGMTYKELKRSLQEKQKRGSIPGAQLDSGNTSDLGSSPPKTSLKFVNLETPARESTHSKLQRFFSYDPDSSTSKTSLEPSKSHPDIKMPSQIESGIASDKKKKRKRKKFLGLF